MGYYYLNSNLLKASQDMRDEDVSVFISLCSWASRHNTDTIPKDTPLSDIHGKLSAAHIHRLAESGIISDEGNGWRLNYFTLEHPDERL